MQIKHQRNYSRGTSSRTRIVRDPDGKDANKLNVPVTGSWPFHGQDDDRGAKHQPKKHFGQNFLHEAGVIQKIIFALALQPNDSVVEIGPGLGALTREILPLIKYLDVVEIDRDVIPELIASCEDSGELRIHQADALKFNFKQLASVGDRLRIVGNLPYNISTPLLFHLLDEISIIKDMHFMLQKEVVERMVAQPGQAAYGRLSVMVQYYCQVEMLFKVKPGAFIPPPKVDSAVIRLIPHQEKPFIAQDVKLFAEIVRLAFGQRRKTLRNSLQGMLRAEQLQTLMIDPQQRAERVAIKSFVEMANFVYNKTFSDKVNI